MFDIEKEKDEFLETSKNKVFKSYLRRIEELTPIEEIPWENLTVNDVYDLYKKWLEKLPFFTPAVILRWAACINEFVEFLCDKYPDFHNPFKEMKRRGRAQLEEIIIKKNNRNKIDRLVNQLSEIADNAYEKYKAQYLKALINLGYDGVPVSYIPLIKEENIDFENKTISLNDKLYHLRDETMDLIKEAHKMEDYGIVIESSELKPWRQSYIPMFSRVNGKDPDEKKEESTVQGVHLVIKDLLRKIDWDLDYQTIVYLGMYDRMVGLFGKEATDNIVTLNDNKRNNRLIKDLLDIEGNLDVIGGTLLGKDNKNSIVQNMVTVKHD